MDSGKVWIDADTAEASYLRTMDKGLLKILFKTSIVTIRSYCGSRLFNAIGIDRRVASRYFVDTTFAVCGIGLDDIVAKYLAIHSAAHSVGCGELTDKGEYAFRRYGERHYWNPESVKAM